MLPSAERISSSDVPRLPENGNKKQDESIDVGCDSPRLYACCVTSRDEPMAKVRG
jgi:hypothetical protein